MSAVLKEFSEARQHFVIKALGVPLGAEVLGFARPQHAHLAHLTAMFNPLPAIALLPVALLWFGLGKGNPVFVLVHSVRWPLAGFRAVPQTLRRWGMQG